MMPLQVIVLAGVLAAGLTNENGLPERGHNSQVNPFYILQPTLLATILTALESTFYFIFLFSERWELH